MKLLSYLFVIFLFTSHLANASSNECPVANLVYTDGNYEIRLDKDQGTSTLFLLKMTDLKTGKTFSGIVGFGSGYSTPIVGITLPCGKGQNNSEKSCGYHGTAYEIDGENTRYAFSTERNLNNPILFPDLHKKMYYARNANMDAIDEIPKDIWHFKECHK